MKMYEAVTFVPPRDQFRRESKFTPVFKALMLVAEGKYLPVECRSSNEAAHLKQECTRRGLTAERRQKTVFIQGVATAPYCLPTNDTDYPGRTLADPEGKNYEENFQKQVAAANNR